MPPPNSNNPNNIPNGPFSPYGPNPPAGPGAYPGNIGGNPGNLGGAPQQPFNPYTSGQSPQAGFPLPPQTPQPQQTMFNQPFQRPMSPPPQQPSVPFFLDPNGPYAHIGAPPPHRRKRKGRAFAVMALIAVVIVGGIIVAMQGGGSDPDELFQTAIANSLATNSYSQKEVSGQDNIQLKQDVSDSKKPRQSGTVDLSSLNSKLEGYSSIDNSYIRYTQLPDGASSSTATILNKWEQIRKNGALPDSYTPTAGLEDMFDARTSIMGDYIIGNFSQADQQTLVSLIQSKAVYTYDPNAVSSEDVEGQPVMRYDVKINPGALTELNQKVGAMMGLSQTDVDAVIKQIDPDTVSKSSIKMYISTDSQRLIKVAMTEGDQTYTTTYTSFNSSVVSNEPTADFQYEEFQALLTGKAGSSLTGKAQDTERKADIDSLATYIGAYRLQSGFYPSLANMNDAAWVAANLKNIPDSTLTDPNGTTKQFAQVPTPNQYSYQPYKDSSLGTCDGGSCGYYKVAATLSDGTVYSKTATAGSNQ